MRLLIVTSEPLNPQNILSSTFELSQAKILKKEMEVCIISVSPPDSFSASFKTFLKNIFLSGFSGKSALAFKRTKTILSVLVGRNRSTANRYIIDGVDVYEGMNYKYVSRSDFSKTVRDWVKAGLGAYHYYVSQSGKPDLVHAHGRFMYAGALALEIKKSQAVPYIYTEHSSSYRSGTAPSAAKPVLNEIVRNASAVVAVSEPLLRAFESFLGSKIEPGIIMPNVLDPVFEVPVEKRAPQTVFRFLNIASFLPIKGLDILLKAFKLAFSGDARFQLTICGDGPLKNELFALRDDLALQDCVFFPGNVPKERIREYIDNSDTLVVSSLQETFGVAVIEALSRGCPVIATRCGGPEDIVTEKVGTLVDPGNYELLGQAMKQMVTGYRTFDPGYIRNYAISRFGSDAFLKSSIELYRHTLN